MRNLIKLSAAILFIGVLSSCNDDTEPPRPVMCYDGTFPNEDATECLCPEETHYALNWHHGKDEERIRCVEKGPDVYKAELGGNNCFTESKNFPYDHIGYIVMKNNLPNPKTYMDANFGFGSVSDLFGGGVGFYYSSLSQMEDGRLYLEYEFRPLGYPQNCLDWEERGASGNVVGYGKGYSNAEHTAFETQIEWRDVYHDTVLDIGTMKMWQE